MDPDDAPDLAALPGAAHLGGPFLRRLESLDAVEAPERASILRDVADVLGVFIARDLVQFVFMPPQSVEPEGGPIDLIAPVAEPEPQVAWFTVDEAGYDEYRDTVTLIGDLADLLNPPIVLDLEEEDDDPAPPAD